MTEQNQKPPKEKGAKSSFNSWIIIEFFLWLMIAFLYMIGDIIEIASNVDSSHFWVYFLRNKASSIIIGSVLLIFPILFKLIFGEYPLLLLKNLINNKYGTQIKIDGNDNTVILDKRQEKELSELKPLEYLQQLSEESELLSKNIFNRSNTYLFVGSLIALIGILYFSFQVTNDISSNSSKNDLQGLTQAHITLELLKANNSDKNIDTLISGISEAVEKSLSKYEFNEGTNISTYIATYLPRFGALFFIEFIAFFFLRQYRITMDEFKYYESIKRNREEIIFKIKYLEESENDNNLDVIKSIILFDSNPDIIKKEDTTELIEKRKLSKEEVGIMEKLLDTLTKLKGN